MGAKSTFLLSHRHLKTTHKRSILDFSSIKFPPIHMDQRIILAIENRNTLEFWYEGYRRIVEPHCYGLTHADNEGLRLIILNEKFSETKEYYRRGDKNMTKIFIEL